MFLNACFGLHTGGFITGGNYFLPGSQPYYNTHRRFSKWDMPPTVSKHADSEQAEKGRKLMEKLSHHSENTICEKPE